MQRTFAGILPERFLLFGGPTLLLNLPQKMTHRFSAQPSIELRLGAKLSSNRLHLGLEATGEIEDKLRGTALKTTGGRAAAGCNF